MPGLLFHVGATAICPHGGQVTVIPTNTRVLVMGQPVALLSDVCMVAGCAFTIPPAVPMPCLKVQWLVGATRVLVMGQPPLVQSSVGLCLNPLQAPQGPPTVIMTQTRVIAT